MNQHHLKKYLLLATAFMAVLATSAHADLVTEKFESAGHYHWGNTGPSGLVGGPTVVYDNLAAPSAPNVAFSSTNLSAVFGDTYSLTDTGRLNELGFGVFNSTDGGANVNALVTTDITFSFFDAALFDAADYANNFGNGSLIGQATFNLDFGAGLAPGFFTTGTLTGLAPLGIDILTNDIVMTQTLSNITGGTTRTGVVYFNTNNIGTAADNAYLADPNTGADGFYTFGTPTYLAATINLTVIPEPTSAAVIGMVLWGGCLLRRRS